MSQLLILVRHSLPEIRDDLPARQWDLSEEGRTRAERLAQNLIHYQPDRLFSSPEPKALETAGVIARKVNLPVQIVEDLREHDRSLVGHLSKDEFEGSITELFSHPDSLVFGSETANEAHERFFRAVSSCLVENENSTIVVVSHGTVISLLVSRLTGQPVFQLWSELGLPGLIVLDMQAKQQIAFENTF